LLLSFDQELRRQEDRWPPDVVELALASWSASDAQISIATAVLRLAAQRAAPQPPGAAQHRASTEQFVDCMACFESRLRVRLPCCHNAVSSDGFCEGCVKGWLKARAGRCPLCDAELLYVGDQIFCLSEPSSALAARVELCDSLDLLDDGQILSLITAGAELGCTSRLSVRYRTTPSDSDEAVDNRKGAVVRKGVGVVVLSRKGDWVETSGGWLPLLGCRGGRLFDVDWTGIRRAKEQEQMSRREAEDRLVRSCCAMLDYVRARARHLHSLEMELQGLRACRKRPLEAVSSSSASLAAVVSAPAGPPRKQRRGLRRL